MDVEISLNPVSVNLGCMDRLRGVITIVVAYISLRCLSLSTIFKVLSVVKCLCSREIGIDDANIAWEAVRQHSFFFLGRVACLEFSLAFVLFALTKGLSATLCVGVANEPFRSHAWIELDGKPFREADYLKQHFRRLLAV